MESKDLSDMQVEIAQEQDPQPNVHIVVVEVTNLRESRRHCKKILCGDGAGWVHLDDAWRIAYVQRQTRRD